MKQEARIASNTLFRATAAAVILILVSACGGQNESAISPDEATPTTVRLPGTQAFGLTDEEFASNVEAVESHIAACMAEAGFEYVPVDVTAVLEVGVWMRADPSMSAEEYKGQWGYGISTRFDNPAREIGLGPQNLRIYQELSESDRIAYDRTLFGDDPEATFAISLDDEDFSGTGGCTGEAVNQVFPPEMLSASFINPKDLLIESDPRAIAAMEGWAGCMAEDGYDYVHQDEIIEEYEDLVDLVVGDEDPETLTGPALDALRKLQEEEIAVALKDLECEAPLSKLIREIEIELFGALVSG